MTAVEPALERKSKKAKEGHQGSHLEKLTFGNMAMVPVSEPMVNVDSTTRMEHLTSEFNLEVKKLLEEEKGKNNHVKNFARELNEKKIELKTAQNNEKKLFRKVAQKQEELARKEEELALKERALNQQGEALKLLVQKLVAFSGFLKYVSRTNQLMYDYVQSRTLEEVGKAFEILMRRKAFNWNPYAQDIIKRDYTKMVLEEIPEISLIDHV